MQLKSIIGLLRSAAPTRVGGQINFVLGNRGSIVESDFYTKLKKLDVQEGNKDRIFADHITQVCEAHSVLPTAGARTCKAKHRGIEGEH